ncbi:MAG: sulfatase-like hydrolase/transferase, partial [Actinomycetia bacterium]|nr:sulfatase-like hydrolase/transferase [Actinomycetes bacterium]
DEWLVLQAYQQHLLQVGFMDKIVGDIVARLEDEGMYDDALIVVTADHGIAVRPNIPDRRQVTEATIGEIAAVPLFIKQPGQNGGFVDTYRAETIDVLPTITDILGIDLPWATPGVSLFSGERPIRLQSRVEGPQGVVTFGVDGSEARAIAASKVERFGVSGPFGLAPDGYAELLGQEASNLRTDELETYTTRLTFPENYRDVNVDSLLLPTWVTGTVEISNAESPRLVVAIVVNGDISAVTMTYEGDDGEIAFGAMIPPDSLISGNNDVTAVVIEGLG